MDETVASLNMERATDLTKSPASHGTFDAEMLDAYAQACGWVLARAHAKASELSVTIAGILALQTTRST